MNFNITKLDEQQLENLSVSAIDDVQLSNLNNYDVLTYSEAINKWINVNFNKEDQVDTFDSWELSATDQNTFTTSFIPVYNTEFVILNGIILTKAIDYTIYDDFLTIDQNHQLQIGWVVTVKYRYTKGQNGEGIGNEGIPINIY
jgi:hypothetical protein